MATQINTNQIKDEAVTAGKLAPGPAQYAASTTAVTVENTTTETSLWSFTLDGGDLGNNGLLVVRGAGQVSSINTSQGFRLKLKLGATEIVDIDTTLRIDTDPAAFEFAFYLKADGDTSSQDGQGHMALRGVGVVSTGELPGAVGTGAEDHSGDLTVDVRWSWDAASASNTITFENGTAELFTPGTP
jgi:hypothetical protein